MTRAPCPATDADLLAGVERYGTAAYVYDLQALSSRYAELTNAFGEDFAVRYAVKANPNSEVLRHLHHLGALFDASSIGEVRRAIAIGAAPEAVSFTGPGKRRAEVEEAVDLGIGAIVLESLAQAHQAQDHAARLGRVQSVMLRISPSTSPRGFGARMTGRATQFGVDEENAADALAAIVTLPNLRLEGLHFYSGSNSLDAEAIAQNISICGQLAIDLGATLPGPMDRLIFGSGFGVPYHDGQQPLQIAALRESIKAAIAPLARNPATRSARLELELGRWLVAPCGVLLTSVLTRKSGRGSEICILDAGFNAHLAACGMMGSALRRNWPIRNVTAPDRSPETVTLAGPLCTSIDLLARDLVIASPLEGDVLAVDMSGAYGFTASPAGFISQPTTLELIWDGTRLFDATNSGAEHIRR